MDRLGFDLILLGAPAAGKDTQAALLRRRYRLRPIESGKHWRRLARANSAAGRKLRQTFGRGKPAPVGMMKHFLLEQVKRAPAAADLLFIGNPRLKPEAQLLAKLLTQRGRDFLAVAIDLPESEIRRRSLRRRRDEQDWKYLDNRIKMHKLQVGKTLKYFQKLDRLKRVNGKQAVPAVAKAINSIINDHRKRQANSSTPAKR